MASDRTLEIRRAALTALKDYDPLADIVLPESMFAQGVMAMPDFPFVRMGAPSSAPLRAACVDGSQGTFTVHAFSRGVEEDGYLQETAEDHAARIGGAIAAGLGGRALPLDDGGAVKITWTGMQLLMDTATAGVFHAVVSFGFRTLS